MSTPLTYRGRTRPRNPKPEEVTRVRLLVKAYDTASIAVTQLGDVNRDHKPEDLRAIARALRLAADFIEEVT